MFDFVHERKRLVQVVLALIILPFAFWGVDSYRRSGDAAGVVATVNGKKITGQEFESALRQQQDRLRQMLGANFDPEMLNNPEMRRVVLDNLIAQNLLTEQAKAAGLTVSDEQMSQVIQGIEAFQDNGQFDKKRYEDALAGKNMSPLIFEARLRNDLLGQQVRDAYMQNGFASNSVIDNVIRLYEQQRVVSTSSIPLQSFMAQAHVDESAVKEYYEQHQKEFEAQEQVKVEYVKLSEQDLQGKVEVKAEEVRKYYDEHKRDLEAQEERRAAHILIAVAEGVPQAEQDEALAKAEKLLQQARKNPAGFAELARKNSQDPGSARNGGDLGFFGRGLMVKSFDDAVFSLKQGEISEVVKSDFGYHIIKLLAVKPTKLLSFDEAREDIASKLRQQRAADLFAELAEKFSNTVYEQSDTLKPAAELAGARIEQSNWLDKGKAADEPWTAKMLQAIFTDEVIKDKRNTAAIEVAPNTLVAARVLEHRPAATRVFDEVKETIRQKLLRQQAMSLAAEQGKAVLEQLQHGSKPRLKWTAAQTVSLAQQGAMDRELVRKIFRVDAAKLPQYLGSEVPQEGYMLVRIDAVMEGGKPDKVKHDGYAQRLRQLAGEEMFRANMDDMRQQASVKVSLPEGAPTQP